MSDLGAEAKLSSFFVFIIQQLDLIVRCCSDFKENFFSNQTDANDDFFRNMVQMGGSMIFMMTLCWKLSMIPFIVVPIILMASKIFGVYYDVFINI